MHTIYSLILLLQEHGAAAAAGAEAKTGLLTPSGGLMFWTLIIFVALAFILSRFAFKPIIAAVAAREKALEDAIAGAQSDREESARVLAEHRTKIEAARAEAQKIIADSRITGESVRAGLIDETRIQQQDMLDRARREIDAEKNRAIAELRREAVDLAIAGASKVIGANLDDAGNRRIVEDFLASIPAAPAKA